MFLFPQKRNKKGRNGTKQVSSIYLRTGIKFLAYITEISLLPDSFGTPGITKNNLLV